jgi:hypothetical protein
MKKSIFMAVIAVAVISASCRKTRTCECKNTSTTVTTGYQAGTTTETTSSKVTAERQKKQDFKMSNNCFSTKGTYTFSGGSGNFAYTDVTTWEQNCELK